MSDPKVLVVDDEEDQLALLTELLIDQGLDVLSASGGEECLEIMKRLPIDVVVLDVLMPGLDGAGSLREIKKSHPATEVIMLSGLADINSVVTLMHRGAFDYLIKPPKMESLVSRIRDAHRRKVLRSARDNS